MAKKRKECPFCYAEVNKENFNKHLTKVHNDLSEKDFEKKGLEKPGGAGSRRPRKVGKRASKKGKKISYAKRNAAIAAIICIVVASALGALWYQTRDRNRDTTDETTGNGNGGGNGPVDLPVAVMTTTLGTIKIELDTDSAPVTAGNFIDLANSGFYEGLIFHRVDEGFVIQGGGFDSDGEYKTADSIPWEGTGLLNIAYTISMARQEDPNSASSQFFINTVDNPHLDNDPPYVVFGKVVEGFSVVDAIEALPTTTHDGHKDWPEDPPVITGVVIEE